jgi:hypothetical protein
VHRKADVGRSFFPGLCKHGPQSVHHGRNNVPGSGISGEKIGLREKIPLEGFRIDTLFPDEIGIGGRAQEEIIRSITSFALYGFPESHSASFALLVYASCYLKTHHPTAFYACLLNAWPMGFYHPATLVKDAQRRGIEMRPVDVDRSGWRCRWEKGAVRIAALCPRPQTSRRRRHRGAEEAGALR